MYPSSHHRSVTGSALLLTLFLGASPAFPDAPQPGDRPLWCVPTVTTTPDARTLLEGGEWPGSCMTGFLGLPSGRLGRSQPLVWLSRDDSAVRVAWRIPRIGDRPFRADARERDGALWTDDAFEVFLDPGHTHREYVQFIVNSAGALYDGKGRDAAWNSTAQVQVAQNSAAWAGVLSVPFSDLGVSALPEGTLWGANFAVDRSPEQRPEDGWGSEDAILVWSPLIATLHEPTRSGHLVFSSASRVAVRDLGRPWWRQLRVLGATEGVTSEMQLQDAAGETVWRTELARDRAFEAAPPVLAPGAYRLALSATQDGRPVTQAIWPIVAAPPVDVRLSCLALRRTLQVDARLEMPDAPEEAAVNVVLVDKTGKTVREGALRLVKGAPPAPLEWSFADLPAGPYTVRASQVGQAEVGTSIPWELPAAPEWLGSRAGMFDDDVVLKPWTPLEVAPRLPLTVDCWGRRMIFTPGGVPASVVAKGQELLAGPVEWVAVVDGKEVRWSDRGLRVLKRTPGVLEFEAHQQGNGLRIDCKGRMEFDGFLRLDCSVSARGEAVSLDSLELHVPFRSEVAKLLHHFPKPSVWVKVDMSRFNARAVLPEGWRSPFLYHVWVGDEERGLQWLTETDELWRPEDPERAIELTPSGDRTTLSLNLIGKATRLEPGTPRPYTFALQASPVKPIPKDYREWRYAQVAWYGQEKAPYRREAADCQLTYPARGLFEPARGTLELTVTPHFDSTAHGELNRSLFFLSWSRDRSVDPPVGVWFYWNQDDRGMRVVVRQGGQFRVVYGAPFPWKPGETHTVAFTWGENGSGGSIFADGRKLASTPSGSVLDADTDLSEALLSLGDSNCDFTVKQWRISSEVLAPEQLGKGAEPMKALASTLLLDRFENVTTGADGVRITTPAVSVSGARGTLAKGIGQEAGGLNFAARVEGRNFLDSLHDRGLRAIGFHENWAELQGFPRTERREELHSLIEAAHAAGLRIILYGSWQIADIAPEYPLYSRECEIIMPDRFLYTREPKQTDYPVCARSAWSDFQADGLQKLFAEFGHDGIYSDGLTYPGECMNRLHGCGYVGEDGKVHPTFSLFAMRDAVKRFARILQDQGKPTLFVCHTSGSITLPTLSFCDAYLDAEHLTGQPRPFRMPLDAFRAEFMGHNFGLPAYFLVYDWHRGMTTQEGLAIALLHDTEVPWSWEAMTPIWDLWSSFGVSEAQFLPYWRSEEWLLGAPEGVKVSAYMKQDGEALVVASNLSEQPVRGKLRLRRAIVEAKEALSGKPVEVTQGAILDDFPVWTAKLFRVKLGE